MTEWYLRLYLQKRKNAGSSATGINIIVYLFMVLFTVLYVMLADNLLGIISGNEEYITSQLIALSVGAVISVIIPAYLDGAFKNGLQMKLTGDSSGRIKQIRKIFIDKGISDEEIRGIIQESESEIKCLTKTALRPRHFAEKFTAGAVIAILIGGIPSLASDYIEYIIVLLSLIMVLVMLAWIGAFIYSCAYNVKIQQYRDFAYDLTQMLYTYKSDNQPEEDIIPEETHEPEDIDIAIEEEPEPEIEEESEPVSEEESEEEESETEEEEIKPYTPEKNDVYLVADSIIALDIDTHKALKKSYMESLKDNAEPERKPIRKLKRVK